MAITYKKTIAHFVDVVNVQEAEELLGWIQLKPTNKIDLSLCTHMHPANLQVLMASKVKISHWPKDAELMAWIKPVLEIS